MKKFFKWLFSRDTSCLHENTTAKHIKNGYFKVKCEDCGHSWVE